jgi:SAM-dependent methyltransferase
MKVIQLEQCPACGGGDLRELELGDGVVLHRCADCETVSAPEYADPKEIYVDGYMFGDAPGGFGLDVTGAGFQEYLGNVALRRVSLIERATGIECGSHLDVGSGTGEVLAASRDRGWAAQGVEPERTAAEMARGRGLDVEIAMLEDSGLPEQSYDVVSAFHVLEHVPDTRTFLRMLARWARPGGFVVIEVPNFGSLQRRRRGVDWPGLRPLEHVVHFSPKTLPLAFRAAGIEPVLTRTPVYLNPPESLDQALADLARARVAWLTRPLSRPSEVDGNEELRPTAAGWAVLRTVGAVHDRLGLGGVVFCVGRVAG